MSRQNPWAKHRQRFWLERSRDERLDLWLRIASLAYAKRARNGHATFAPGELSMIFASLEEETGELKPRDRSSIGRAIRQAISMGLLDPSSRSVCLVVPTHGIEGGLRGSEFDVCPLHSDPVKPAKTVRTGRKRVKGTAPVKASGAKGVKRAAAGVRDVTKVKHLVGDHAGDEGSRTRSKPKREVIAERQAAALRPTERSRRLHKPPPRR